MSCPCSREIVRLCVCVCVLVCMFVTNGQRRRNRRFVEIKFYHSVGHWHESVCL